ncbi:dihydrodipicolinate synthase family protein [Mesorhizobium sp. IMUNJ 23232]|uniref:dihydrodipicolinate synthase family protein n=1 Tax=Mesorhizobium sp. IMUNJ 23232 TaxID=3376064 RepID=UPI0037B1ABA7
MTQASGLAASHSGSLPATRCLAVAAATPVTDTFQPDALLLAAHCKMLLEAGCDGVALFGTTGEGPEFSVRDRMAGLDAVLAAGIPAKRLIVSVTALAIPDIVELARHALAAGVDSILLMPPCVYRSGVTEEGTYRFYATVIDRLARDDLRLCLYHFPDICGVPLTPRVVRRLDEGFPGIVTGIKDSGGDLGFTETLVRSFSHLGVYTGTEIHVPRALAIGARGTICGLANVMPRLMRAMFEAPTAFDRRKLVPLITSGDLVLSRQSFAASIKAVLAHASGQAGWNRMIPPINALPHPERRWMLEDFFRWDASLPSPMRTFASSGADEVQKVTPLRRAS